MGLLKLGYVNILGRSLYYERYQIFRISVTTIILMAFINFDLRHFWIIFIISIITVSFSYKITDYLRGEAENRRIKINMQKGDKI